MPKYSVNCLCVIVLVCICGCSTTPSRTAEESYQNREARLEEALTNGTPGAQSSLAKFYYARGRYADAFPLLTQLAATNNEEAKHMLLVLYLNGFYASQSFAKAYSLAVEIKQAGGTTVPLEALTRIKTQNKSPDGNYERYILPVVSAPGAFGLPLRFEERKYVESGKSECLLQYLPGFGQ